ncbi:MAG TPA: FAD-dependent oxidoreductase [Thermomicrobiales bacterium]|nr:FAD-dependent oxidoreductase [Thermomicrobiales bacterium]
MSQTEDYDLVVIGAGPAGESAASLAAVFGHSVLVVERAAPGGVVTTTGGAPTKTLREAALALTGFHHRDVYGLPDAPVGQVVLRQIRERARDVCTTLQRATETKLRSRGIEYLSAQARLAPGRKIVVTANDGSFERAITGRKIVIATGSRPFRPASVPFEDPDVFDSDKFFEVDRRPMPRNLLIVGGGAIGVEFATLFAAVGVDVTLMQKGEQLVPTMDDEIADLLREALDGLGVHVVLGESPRRISRVNGLLVVERETGDTMAPEAVLYAVGRSVNTEVLGLDEVGIDTGPRGAIVVDDHFRTSAPDMYAVGDVIAPTLASIAMEQGRAAVCHAFGITLKDHVHPLPVSAVYGMPEVAGAGLTEEACQEQGIAYEVGRCRFDEIPRGVISGRTEGLLKLVFGQEDRKLLGVHAIADMASELVGMGQAVLHFGGSIDTFIDLTLNTPTYTMAYKVATADGLMRLARRHGPAFLASFQSNKLA